MKKILSIFIVFMLVFGTLNLNVHAENESLKIGVVTTASGNLNVRSGATTNSAIIAKLYRGSYVTLISKKDNWWYVEYSKNSFGYCHENYIKTINSSVGFVNITNGSLNIRSGPGSSYSKIGSIYKNDIVLIIETIGNWHKIIYDGNKTGFVSKVYIGNKSSNSSIYDTIKLNVPNFKQTDSRWANTYIASSGKTIAQIGCATTGIAMMESFRTKTTIYPNTMSKKLKYTSSGNVYWPSHYTAITSNNNYLENIYKQLKSGKCVLFGAKNSYGSQHWVVITGYTGGSTLNASGFTINDPGSNTRTTLQSFLKSYPTFYKYFVY